MILSKFNKTHVAQLTLIAFLAIALIMPIVSVNADDSDLGGANIALLGQIDAATIDISIIGTSEQDGAMHFDIPASEVDASDSLTVTSTSLIPVVMSLESIYHQESSWRPTLIATDPTLLGLVDAQKKARLTISTDTTDDNYLVAPTAAIVPTGTGDTLDGELTYPVPLGVIREMTRGDADDEVDVVIYGELEVSHKRYTSKAFDSMMVLNFAAPENDFEPIDPTPEP